MQSQVLNYSTAKKDDGTFRLDAEHYQEKYLLNQNKLLKFGAVPLHSMISRPVMTGHTPSMKIDSYYGDDVAFVKTDNLREFRITGEFSHRLSQKGNEVIKRSVLQKGDLIMTIIGATYKIVGRSALVRSEDLPANINQNIALIRLKKAYSPEFLSAYLNSNIGKLATWYLSRQTEQVNLNCREIEKILVPKVSKEFSLTIENTYKKAVLSEHGSRSAFFKAENLLLTEIGLNHWQPKHQLSFVKNYSDTEQAERIDAEYFQPKYEEIEQAIKQYSDGYSTIGEEFKQNKSTFKIDDKKIHQYVEIGSVNVSNGEILANEVIGEELPANAKRALKKNDVIVSKVRTYRGAITIVEESGYVGSGAFTVLRENGRINKETLLAFLHSKPLLEWSLKPNTGTSYPVIVDNDLLKLPIPLIPESKQTEIQQKVTESFNLRKQSKRLLECAKRAVEMAIEQDEQAAMDWLKEQAGM
ncbi:restriction endonuclease subunit S [Gammaproteobacteria bacterium AB-CW1]|uniref:Restriction endonuclease subunit S n=1 Tax=Natronospira elongata TaxID=3110268 RepID=A0AAP6JJN9_9GAMM|nr:restriction endonuclease subunit S [Gammaproteobacteria bacterium AB-CW1]